MKKTAVALAVAITALITSVSAQHSDETWKTEYPWAIDGIEYCLNNGIVEGFDKGNLSLESVLTKGQMAKILVKTFNLSDKSENDVFFGVSKEHWAYKYLLTIQKYIINKKNFNPEDNVTREEFAATIVLSSGLTEANIRNSDILSYNFDDYMEIDPEYTKLLSIAVERGYLMGDNNKLRPKDLLTRAEVCTMIYRVTQIQSGKIIPELGVKKSSTPIIGSPTVTVEQAKAWATAKGAHQRFIDIAPTYWKYGEITGIRPEILYAQAAKETGFGKYTGAVKPEMNNWAGIKGYGKTGDATEDHETFATPDDGVRAHFNHMSAYIGIAPIGEVHQRYYSVKSLSWAGEIKTLEQLGGRWCPDLYYGYSILHNYLEPMSQY